jgi:hypothetical protein
LKFDFFIALQIPTAVSKLRGLSLVASRPTRELDTGCS